MRHEKALNARLAGDVQALELLESLTGEDGKLPCGWSKDAKALAASKRLRRRLLDGDLPGELAERCAAVGLVLRAPTQRERNVAHVATLERAAGEDGVLERGWSKTPHALGSAYALRCSCAKGELDADLEARLERIGFDVRRRGVRRAVVCAETGEVYASATEAARSLGHERSSAINNCLRGGRGTAYGLHWRYADVSESKVVGVVKGAP